MKLKIFSPLPQSKLCNEWAWLIKFFPAWNALSGSPRQRRQSTFALTASSVSSPSLATRHDFNGARAVGQLADCSATTRAQSESTELSSTRDFPVFHPQFGSKHQNSAKTSVSHRTFNNATRFTVTRNSMYANTITGNGTTAKLLRYFWRIYETEL